MTKFFSGIAPILILIGCAAPGPHPVPAPGGWGKYDRAIRVEWEPGRKMRLLEDAHYVSPEGVDWLAPKGWDIDGASIPKPFWCTIGGPYEDFYRDASVFHDVACDQRKVRWQDVHHMFYTAMRCSGVDERKAKIMYAAVYRFGPRWPEPPSIPPGTSPSATPATTLGAAVALPPRTPTQQEVNEIKEWVTDNNPSLKEIETTTSKPGKAGRR